MAYVPRAMISSTTRDLPRHREQAMDACLRQDFLPKMMEHLPPSADDAVRRSLSLVDEADVYVLILGLRYGEIRKVMTSRTPILSSNGPSNERSRG
jgi:Domain of unknown function (DUF4062)